MRFTFRHLLLLGALLGLLWQGVAYASPPCSDMHQNEISVTSAMAGMEDCMEAETKLRDDSLPCTDMQAGCFAMVGCTSLVALETLHVTGSRTKNADLIVVWTTGPILLGRNEAPIPDPPSILG